MKFDYSGEIRSKIIREIQNGEYAGESRLPRETVLAERFGISRNHLREVLAQLEMEGFITRRHGVGTVINHHVCQVKNRMDIETEFLDIIRQSGYEPGISRVSWTEEEAGPYVSKKLGIAEGTKILRVIRICTADGKPAIYCEDVLETRLIQKEFTRKDLEPPIFYFLKNICGIEAYMDLTQLHAVLSDETVATALEIPVGIPLLNMEEVDYDIEGNRIFYAKQFFVDTIFEQTVMRKKL
ncbi:MAG: GntR family transcriptional regulator [Firmicutes bacterium]|nr:GntR family transcriptional regulator [Bacillota bacterium]